MQASDLTIRDADEQDINRVVELGRRDLLEGPYKNQLADNPDYGAALMKELLSKPGMRILVAEEDQLVVGVFAFYLFPHYFSGEMTAGQVIWYVEPKHRGRASMELLWAAEKAAFDMGAIRMQVTSPTDKVEVAGLIYKRLKYKPIETTYQVKLSDRMRPCPS